MNIIKKNISVILGIVLALVAALLVYVVIQQQAPSVPVVVAVDKISVGEQITDKNVTVQNFPASMVPSTTYKDVAQIIGMTATEGPIMKGAMIYTDNVTGTSALKSLIKTYCPVSNDTATAPVLTPGKWVAVEFPAEIAMKGLSKGDFVDIYGEQIQTETSSVVPIVKNALILELPSKDYNYYIIGVEEKYAAAAAAITIRKEIVSLVMPEQQPVISSETLVDVEPKAEKPTATVSDASDNSPASNQ